MQISTKVLEQFNYFNFESVVDSVFGNWAVSKEGDVVNSVFPYAIFAIYLRDCDWKEELRTKVWFRPDNENSLRLAIERALQISNKNNNI